MRSSLVFLVLYFSLSCFSAELLFVASKTFPSDSLSVREISDIFLKNNRYTSDGKKIRPIDQSLGTKARDIFLKKYIKKNEMQMAEHWMKQKQRNGLVQPIQLESNLLVSQLIVGMQGTIGYIFIDHPASTNFSKMKKIKVKPE